MEEKDLILGLDVSTSTIGISLFKDMGTYGELVVLNHVSPVLKPNPENPMESLWQKAELFRDYLKQNYSKLPIKLVVIEESLKTSTNPNTAAKLNQFAGIIYNVVRTELGLSSEYITVNDARKYGLPELYASPIGKKHKALFGGIPRKIQDVKINEYRKLIVLCQVAQRYPEIPWLLTTKMTIDKKNCDRADSMVVVMGYMAKLGKWQLDHFSTDKAIEFATRNIVYKKYCKSDIDSLDEKPDFRKLLKQSYLRETFKIKDYLNVDFG